MSVDGQPTPDRPTFPASYGVDRALRSEMLAWDDVAQRLESARNYWLCTTRTNHRPHVAPVWGLWINEAFYFSTDPASLKGRNLAAEPNVVVHLESGDDVVVVEGSAERITDPTVAGPLVDAYEAKYGIRFDPTNPSYGLYVVKPTTAYGWTEQSFPTTATRWRFPTV